MSVAAVRRVVSRLAPDRPPTDAELVLAIAPGCSAPPCGARRAPCADRETAFAELVERYGPMVLGACRRVLADAHDAEDAFQAAFLRPAPWAGGSTASRFERPGRRRRPPPGGGGGRWPRPCPRTPIRRAGSVSDRRLPSTAPNFAR